MIKKLIKMLKKILITGAAGFIGSHLAELCVKSGYNVKVFDRYNSDSNFGWLENSDFRKDIEFVLGDIRDYDSISKAIKDCNIVFHLAALIGIPYSYISPLAYIKTNIEGTYNILESSKNYNLDQIMITSTSETYGSAQYTPIDEKHPLVGQSPYSASKIAADQLSLSYFNSYNLPVKIIRPFNTFGPRQSKRAIIPTIVSQSLNSNSTIKLGNLEPTRDFTYVEDTCRAYLEILKKDIFFGEVVNVGSNNEISIKNLVDKICSILKIKMNIVNDSLRERPSKSEVQQLVCDNNKIINNTDWRPKETFENGIIKTLDWIKNYYKFSNSDQYHV